MIWISGVDGALRVLRGNTLGIKAGCALSKRASSGPTRLAPATSSYGEAWFGVKEAPGMRVVWGTPPVEPGGGYIGGGRPAACVLADGDGVA